MNPSEGSVHHGHGPTPVCGFVLADIITTEHWACIMDDCVLKSSAADICKSDLVLHLLHVYTDKSSTQEYCVCLMDNDGLASMVSST